MELRPLVAPFSDSLREALASFDCGSEVVNQYLCNHSETAVGSGIGTILLFLEDREILGYASLGFSQVRLTNTEKKDHPVPHELGAIRLGMLGVDNRHQQRGVGGQVLRSVVGLARRVGELIAVRYLVADANDARVKWYCDRGWVVNRSQHESERLEGRSQTSLRYDLHPHEIPQPAFEGTIEFRAYDPGGTYGPTYQPPF